MTKVLITGCTGFIGYFTTKLFLKKGYEVIGMDNMDTYYSTVLKVKRLNELKNYDNFKFVKGSILDENLLDEVFKKYEFEGILNLAAKCGVRYSLIEPDEYLRVNALGTIYLLERAVKKGIRKFLLASTSSIYANHKPPFKEDMKVDRMISPYAASKKSAENMLYTYHYLYGIDGIVVRYFTVYGPYGRPDMSVFRFIYWIMKGDEVVIYGDGTQKRSFTYIDDIAYGTLLAYEKLSGYEIVNLGNDEYNELMDVLRFIERYTNKKAHIKYEEFHKADMLITGADITKARKLLNWEPKVKLKEGVRRTVEWFQKNWDWIKDIKLPG